MANQEQSVDFNAEHEDIMINTDETHVELNNDQHQFQDSTSGDSGSFTSVKTVGIEQTASDGSIGFLPDVEERPKIGQTFEKIEDAFRFYQNYGKKGGFEVRWATTKKLKNSDEIGRRYILCNREGFPLKRNPIDTLNKPANGKRKRPSNRVGCKACIRVKINQEGLWVIYYVQEYHNHSFVLEEDIHFLKSQRRLLYTQKKLVHEVSNINMGPVVAFNIIKQARGSFENTGATKTDTKNFQRDWNAFIGEYDADMVIEKLSKKKQYLQNFSFEYSMGDDGALTGLFWADQEAKLNYSEFGDVVGFDATYRTNKYRMIFVPFTGIDNHRKCVTFGAGLLSSESIDSYKWLLQSFKKTFGKEPIVLVTDQDPAIKQAIPAIFSTSRHRLCMWHISQKFTEKLGQRLVNTDALKRLSQIVWDELINKEEFESAWKLIMNDYDLNDNQWFIDMFEMRDKWIPAFFSDCQFSGLMKTTSRSEAENYFFGLLSNADLHLVDFMSHFDTALEAQRCIQQKNNHESRYTIPPVKTGLDFEVEASKIYTRNVFYEVQEDIIASLFKCMSLKVEENEGWTKTTVKDLQKEQRNQGFFQVQFCKADMILFCSCLQFELKGTLCRHCYYVLRMSDVKEVPRKYVSKRWTKDVVPRSEFANRFTNIPQSDQKVEIQTMIRDAYFYLDFCIDRLVSNFEKLTIYTNTQKELMAKVDDDTRNIKPMKNKEVIESLIGVTRNEDITVLPPNQINNKGSGKRSRMKSNKEKAIENAQKKQRRCQRCGRPNHNSRSCHKFPPEPSTTIEPL